jgi:hypothetical protein
VNTSDRLSSNEGSLAARYHFLCHPVMQFHIQRYRQCLQRVQLTVQLLVQLTIHHRPPVSKMGAGHNSSAGSLIANALRLASKDGWFCILSNSSPFRWQYYRYVRRCWRRGVPALFLLHTSTMIFAAACQSYAMQYKLVQISLCRRTLLRWFTTSFLYLFFLFFGRGYFRSAYFCMA